MVFIFVLNFVFVAVGAPLIVLISAFITDDACIDFYTLYFIIYETDKIWTVKGISFDRPV
jgi:hypothetical protein